MKQDKNISLGNSYIEIEGSEKEVAQFRNDILDGKILMELSTKPIPKTPVELRKKNLKNYLI